MMEVRRRVARVRGGGGEGVDNGTLVMIMHCRWIKVGYCGFVSVIIQSKSKKKGGEVEEPVN